MLFRNVQQRLSYSFLSDIAAALLDEAVFTIVGKLCGYNLCCFY